MNYWHYESMTIELPVPREQVIGLLRRHVEPVKWIRIFGVEAPFEGEVHESGFSFRRINNYRNNSVPQVTGTFESHPDGTTIHVELAFPIYPMVIAGMSLWMSIMFSTIGLLNGAYHLTWTSGLIGVGLGFICLVMFYGETISAKRLLRKALEVHH
ncbi:MAG: hypothetical protein ACKVH8_16770 [Pirellulales bacterium]